MFYMGTATQKKLGIINSTNKLITIREQIKALEKEESELSKELLPIAIKQGGVLEGHEATLVVTDLNRAEFDSEGLKAKHRDLFVEISKVDSKKFDAMLKLRPELTKKLSSFKSINTSQYLRVSR